MIKHVSREILLFQNDHVRANFSANNLPRKQSVILPLFHRATEYAHNLYCSIPRHNYNRMWNARGTDLKLEKRTARSKKTNDLLLLFVFAY